MKLYSSALAPSPRRVRMFAAEKGLALPVVEVDIAADETRAPAFLAINDVGETPVLELDDGTRLTESLAICRYLESLHPDPNLLGTTPLEQAQIEALVLQIMFRIYVPTTQAFRHTHRFWSGRLRQVPEYGALAREHALTDWQRWNARLANQTYIAGDRYTFADIVAYTTLEFGKPSGIRIAPEQDHLARWHALIGARASARA